MSKTPKAISWLRRSFPRLLTIFALGLGIFGVMIGLYIDSRYLNYFNDHPVTANLIASFLGLPAAYLVVNLAADRAIRWSAEVRRDWAQVITARVVAASLLRLGYELVIQYRIARKPDEPSRPGDIKELFDILGRY